MREKESPAANGAIKSSAGELNNSILTPKPDFAPILTGAPGVSNETPENPAAVYFRNCYAVLVHGMTVRRHLYFNLPAADRTVKRALARGDRADLVLVRLVPVDARHLDGGADL